MSQICEVQMQLSYCTTTALQLQIHPNKRTCDKAELEHTNKPCLSAALRAVDMASSVETLITSSTSDICARGSSWPHAQTGLWVTNNLGAEQQPHF
jgi:hypothetical protein